MKITIDKGLGDSLYVQLYNSIKREIINGSLKPGDKLPSYRWITLKFGINISTVIKAYSMLEDSGIIEIIPGSGSYVKALRTQTFYGGGFMAQCFNKGQGVSKTMINLASNSPYINTYPIQRFKEVLNEITSCDFSEYLAYGDSRGRYELREAFCEYVKEQNIFTDPKSVHVINGSQQCLDIISQAIAKKGNIIAVDDPGYTVADNTFINAGCSIEFVPVENDGLDMEKFKKLLSFKKIDFYYTVPNFQTPTSICWSDEKKQELIHLARKHGFMIIEDDCMSELSFDGKSKRNIISFDAADCVIYVKSFSKILFPSLRMACLVAPPQFAEKLATRKFYSDITSSEFLQKCLTLFIKKGYLKEHISASRKMHEKKYLFIKNEIEKSRNISLEYEPNGGLFLWARLGTNVDPYDFCTAMNQEGILIIPGNVYSHTGKHSQFMHLGYCAAEDASIAEAISKIDSYLSSAVTV